MPTQSDLTVFSSSPQAQRMSSQCNCESWPQTPFNNFLNEMETLIQRIIDEALTE